MARADPFYIIRGEVTDALNEVDQNMSRFHGLQASNPERKDIAKKVETECNSVVWQLNELNSAVDVAAENPARFNLTSEELSSRRRWIEQTQKKVKGIRETLKNATSAPALPPENRFTAANDKFLGSEVERQQLILKKQDEQFDEMTQNLQRIQHIGQAIGDTLNEQEHMLIELDQDVDTTHSRLKATQRKMTELIRKSGSNTQLGVIIFLIIVLVILLVFAFY